MHRFGMLSLVMVALMTVAAVGAIPQGMYSVDLVGGVTRGIVPVLYIDFEFEDGSFPDFDFHYEGTIEVTGWPGDQEITDCTGDAWITGSHAVYEATQCYSFEFIASNKQSVRLVAFGAIVDPTATPPEDLIHSYNISSTYRL